MLSEGGRAGTGDSLRSRCSGARAAELSGAAATHDQRLGLLPVTHGRCVMGGPRPCLVPLHQGSARSSELGEHHGASSSCFARVVMSRASRGVVSRLWFKSQAWQLENHARCLCVGAQNS